jgi:ubiquitin C-terminal hydrolase
VVGRGFVDSAGEAWHEFDDSTVRAVSPREVVSRAAYVLFYRRRRASATPPPSAL